MPLSPPRSRLPRWCHTLTLKIVAIAAVSAAAAALGTAQIVLSSTETDLERLLLANAAADSEGTAALLASKLDTLEAALRAVARATRPEHWAGREAMAAALGPQVAVHAMVDSLVAAAPSGDLLARLEKGRLVDGEGTPNVSDRDYFQRALRTDQPVVSKPLMGRASKQPGVVIAVSAVGSDGVVTGVIAGYLQLASTSLFSNLASTSNPDAAVTLVMDRDGTLLAHPDPQRRLGRAADEPGLRAVFARWHAAGSPIDTEGTAVLADGFVVSMAGIPASDWVLVRRTPQAVAMAPVAAARRFAWPAAGGVALLAALLAGGLGYAMTRPISRLRERAERLLDEAPAPAADAPWLRQPGEVGDLARAFQRVIEQRQTRELETRGLLEKLDAVIDHAEIGIALSRDGRFELVSREFCRIFRCDKHDAVDQPTRSIYPSEAAYQALSARALPAFMEFGAFDGEVEMQRRGGETFWAHLRGRAVAAGDRSKGTIWIIEDVTRAREQRERLTWSSSHDALTGLANRAAFEVLLDQATGRAAQHPFCALFIDLDRFKQVNDSAGHAAGDALLKQVAHQLALNVRASDTVARLGGDEFAVLLNDCPLDQAHAIAEKLRSAVVAYRLGWKGRLFGVGASIGVVHVDAGFADAAAVLAAADAACYEAKRQGRDRVAQFAPPARAAALPIAV